MSPKGRNLPPAVGPAAVSDAAARA